MISVQVKLEQIFQEKFEEMVKALMEVYLSEDHASAVAIAKSALESVSDSEIEIKERTDDLELSNS